MARQTNVTILVDRSRDGVTRSTFIPLHQQAGFDVTQNERRLSERELPGPSSEHDK